MTYRRLVSRRVQAGKWHLRKIVRSWSFVSR